MDLHNLRRNIALIILFLTIEIPAVADANCQRRQIYYSTQQIQKIRALALEMIDEGLKAKRGDSDFISLRENLLNAPIETDHTICGIMAYVDMQRINGQVRVKTHRIYVTPQWHMLPELAAAQVLIHEAEHLNNTTSECYADAMVLKASRFSQISKGWAFLPYANNCKSELVGICRPGQSIELRNQSSLHFKVYKLKFWLDAIPKCSYDTPVDTDPGLEFYKPID
jgi:hypothetical protein